MDYTDLICVLLIVVGLRTARAGVRGLRGEIGVGYRWPMNLLVQRLEKGDQRTTNAALLKIGSAMRVVFGLVIAGIGAWLLPAA